MPDDTPGIRKFLSTTAAALFCMPSRRTPRPPESAGVAPGSNDDDATDPVDTAPSHDKPTRHILTAKRHKTKVILETHSATFTKHQKEIALHLAALGQRAAKAVSDHDFTQETWSFCQHPEFRFEAAPFGQPFTLPEMLESLKLHAADDPTLAMRKTCQIVRFRDDMQAATLYEVFDMVDGGVVSQQALEADFVHVDGVWMTRKLRATTGAIHGSHA